jgi:transposase InsO family protein
VPYRIHTVLTDSGIQFAAAGKPRRLPKSQAFALACRRYGIEHRHTRPCQPWTNGKAERVIRTLEETTVRAFYYENFGALRRRVADSLSAYNFAKHLGALRWQTPHETIQALYQTRSELFETSPDHLTLGPHT